MSTTGNSTPAAAPQAWRWLLLNLLVLPGLGSIKGGHRRAGGWQLALGLIGFVSSVGAVVEIALEWVRAMTDGRPMALEMRLVWWTGGGLVLFFISWFWALATSIRLLHSAQEPGRPSHAMNRLPDCLRRRSMAPPLLMLLCVGMLAMVHASEHWQLRLPPCAMRTLTGIPCPTCGGTRSLLALSGLKLREALRFNPLVALASLSLCGWVLLWLLDVWCDRNWAELVVEIMQRKPCLWALAIAAVVNWIYLMFYLPK